MSKEDKKLITRFISDLAILKIVMPEETHFEIDPLIEKWKSEMQEVVDPVEDKDNKNQ